MAYSPRKQIGLGTKLYFKTSTGSTSTYTKAVGLINLPGPNTSAEDVDTSTLENSTDPLDFFKTFQRGQVDPGEMSLTLAYDSTSSANKKLGTFHKSGALCTWKVVFPSTAVANETFTGFIKSMGRAIEKAAMITRTVGIKVSGNPGFPTT